MLPHHPATNTDHGGSRTSDLSIESRRDATTSTPLSQFLICQSLKWICLVAGVISTLHTLDFERQSKYVWTVEITDGDTNPSELTTTCVVQIDLIDENEFGPHFEPEIMFVSVSTSHAQLNCIKKHLICQLV